MTKAWELALEISNDSAGLNHRCGDWQVIMEKQAKKFKRYDQGEFWRNPSNNVLEKNEIQGTDC